MNQYLLCIDQGTTSSRAIIFNPKGEVIACEQEEFKQLYPQLGWVEHEPEYIWNTTLNCLRSVVAHSTIEARQIVSIGITNQRETTLVWNKQTGQCIYPAIVWQDRRTSDYCEALKEQEGLEALIHQKTGLLLDPYFSATKIRWILDEVEGAQEQAERGELLFGTIDSFLLWRLTGGGIHATDTTNASRTLLFDIQKQDWDDELLALFNIPKSMLPEVKECTDDFGCLSADILGEPIAIGAMIGDQQSALIGHGCLQEAEAKTTYGTGCFLVLNTGQSPVFSQNRLLTTIGYRIAGETHYAMEGSIFMGGATIQWIRDGLQLIEHAKQSEAMAEQTGYNNPVYMVPAFTGLGAPYWDAQARGAILGLTRDTGIKEIVTAGLQSVCYQTQDLIETMKKDGIDLCSMKVDGGMVNNTWLVQFLADLLGIKIQRAQMAEVTAWGAAFLAGLQAGVFSELSDIQTLNTHIESFHANIQPEKRQALYSGWLEAVGRIKT